MIFFCPTRLGLQLALQLLDGCSRWVRVEMYLSQFPIFQRALGSDKKVPAASKVEQDRLREAIRNKEEERKRKRRELKKEAEKKRETKQEEEIKRSVREEDTDFVRKEEDR